MSDSVRISLEFTLVTTDSILFILKESSLSTQAIARPNAAILVPRTALDFVAESSESLLHHKIGKEHTAVPRVIL